MEPFKRERKSTEEVMAMAYSRPKPPETDLPQNRPIVKYDAYDWGIHKHYSRKSLIKSIKAGNVLDCSEEYGIPVAWRLKGHEAVYRGMVFVYGNIKDQHTWDNPEDAVDWFIETSAYCAGK